MTHGEEPRPDPWRKDQADPTVAQPVPGPFPSPPTSAAPYPPPYPYGPDPQAWSGADPNAPAWARQAHAQGAYAPPPTGGHVQPVFPPTPQQQPYQQPGYVPPGWVPGPYPGYPPAPYGAGYPPRGPVKPGVVTGAAVLAFVQAGLLVIGGIVTLAGGTALQSVDVSVQRGLSGVLTVMGFLTLVAAGLLIAGGVTVHNRKPWLLVAGCALSLVLSVWWAVQFDILTFTVTWPLILAIMPIISLSLVFGPAARAWMRTGNAPR